MICSVRSKLKTGQTSQWRHLLVLFDEHFVQQRIVAVLLRSSLADASSTQKLLAVELHASSEMSSKAKSNYS